MPQFSSQRVAASTLALVFGKKTRGLVAGGIIKAEGLGDGHFLL